MQSKLVKQAQQRRLVWIICGAAVVLMALSFFVKKEKPHKKQTNSFHHLVFSSPLEAVDTASVWREKIQKALQATQAQENKTQHDVSALVAENARLRAAFLQKTTQAQQLQKAMTTLQREPAASTPLIESGLLSTEPSSPAIKRSPVSRVISVDSITLPQSTVTQPAIPRKNPDAYVPAGTHVQAVLLGGADAAAGALSQANPKPLLFRLIGRGRLPNHHYSHLKGCVATAAIIGDVSAERGGVRLVRLSCVKPNGAIIDKAVQGTVFGRDGKNGIRGRVVSREGPLIARASLAGFFSGISEGIQAHFSPGSVVTDTGNLLSSGRHIIGSGISSGTQSAFSKIADYHIKRAEQYHPVVQVQAGQVVDIVFTRGFFITATAPIHAAVFHQSAEAIEAINSHQTTSKENHHVD